jgi:DNA invertase Pin-like site-specific DNA recombinase
VTKHAIAYTRVSTSDQVDNGVSLDMQEAKIRAYCDFNDLELSGVIVDAGLSGKNMEDRPGVQQLLTLIKNKSVDAIVIYKLDRLGRSTKDLLEISELLKKKGITLHSITEKLDTSTAMGKFFFTLTGALAEMERGIISERTKAGLQHKKLNNERVSRFVQMGKRLSEQKESDGRIKHLVDDPREQRLLEVARLERQRGTSYNKIAQILTAMGFKNRMGNPFNMGTIFKMLNA